MTWTTETSTSTVSQTGMIMEAWNKDDDYAPSNLADSDLTKISLRLYTL
jgi:hypothetical protein